MRTLHAYINPHVPWTDMCKFFATDTLLASVMQTKMRSAEASPSLRRESHMRRSPGIAPNISKTRVFEINFHLNKRPLTGFAGGGFTTRHRKKHGGFFGMFFAGFTFNRAAHISCQPSRQTLSAHKLLAGSYKHSKVRVLCKLSTLINYARTSAYFIVILRVYGAVSFSFV